MQNTPKPTNPNRGKGSEVLELGPNPNQSANPRGRKHYQPRRIQAGKPTPQRRLRERERSRTGTKERRRSSDPPPGNPRGEGREINRSIQKPLETKRA